jgi:hypothetical protein
MVNVSTSFVVVREVADRITSGRFATEKTSLVQKKIELMAACWTASAPHSIRIALSRA